jgi:hypothetical protein
VPARVLAGRWAKSAKPGDRVGQMKYYQEHVKAEFYADEVGWIPVDCASAVMYDTSPQELRCFGHDAGDFLVMHLDPEIEVDTLHFGKQKIAWLQGLSYWVIGTGTLDQTADTSSWVVEHPK